MEELQKLEYRLESLNSMIEELGIMEEKDSNITLKNNDGDILIFLETTGFKNRMLAYVKEAVEDEICSVESQIDNFHALLQGRY